MGSTCHDTGVWKAVRMKSSSMLEVDSGGRDLLGTTGWTCGSKPAGTAMRRGREGTGVSAIDSKNQRHPCGCLCSVSGAGSLLNSSLLGRLADQFFLDTCSLTRTATQVIKFSTTDVAAALDFDAGNLGRVKLEGTLYGNVGRNFAHDK